MKQHIYRDKNKPKKEFPYKVQTVQTEKGLAVLVLVDVLNLMCTNAEYCSSPQSQCVLCKLKCAVVATQNVLNNKKSVKQACYAEKKIGDAAVRRINKNHDSENRFGFAYDYKRAL